MSLAEQKNAKGLPSPFSVVRLISEYDPIMSFQDDFGAVNSPERVIVVGKSIVGNVGMNLDCCRVYQENRKVRNVTFNIGLEDGKLVTIDLALSENPGGSFSLGRGDAVLWSDVPGENGKTIRRNDKFITVGVGGNVVILSRGKINETPCITIDDDQIKINPVSNIKLDTYRK